MQVVKCLKTKADYYYYYQANYSGLCSTQDSKATKTKVWEQRGLWLGANNANHAQEYPMGSNASLHLL